MGDAFRRITAGLIGEFSGITAGEDFSAFLELGRDVSVLEGERSGGNGYLILEAAPLMITFLADINIPLAALRELLSANGDWALHCAIVSKGGNRRYGFAAQQGNMAVDAAGEIPAQELPPLLRNIVDFFSLLMRIFGAQFEKLEAGEAEFHFEYGDHLVAVDVVNGALLSTANFDLWSENFLHGLELGDLLRFTFVIGDKSVVVEFNGVELLKVALSDGMALSEFITPPASD